MSGASKPWTDKFKKLLPEREQWSVHPWLQPVAHRLLDKRLWRLQHEAVARGAAVGIFWAFVLPVAQIFVAAVHCSWWRANIPVAAAMTMITNPLTIAFWLWLAHQLGGVILGGSPADASTAGAGMLAWLAEFGWPTVLGMSLFAVGGAVMSYVMVKLLWRLRIWLRRSTRR